MKKQRQYSFQPSSLIFVCLFAVSIISCRQDAKKTENASLIETYQDVPFIQEFHEVYKISDNPEDNEVRSIAVDRESNVWIATASGVFRKKPGKRDWEPVIPGNNSGPAYSVAVNPDGDVLLGTWNGIYRYSKNRLSKEEGVKPPISVICNNGKGNYALGPYGIWSFGNGNWEQQDYHIARSVRDAKVDEKGNLWVATDAGLYRCRDGKSKLFRDVSELISCYARAISVDPSGKIWTGVMGGVSVRDDDHLIKNLTPKEGIPSIYINCINQSPDGVMWVGTNVGVVRFAKDGTRSLRFSKRWLTDDKVTDVAFDAEGNAWVATDNGVSAIKCKRMTLEDKEKYFYSNLMRRHIREPWIAAVTRLAVPGDTTTSEPTDDDNDGQYTSMYMVMESLRYATTKDTDARIKARKAFDFLRYLQEVTETDGFFARTIIPVTWSNAFSRNRTFDAKQIAEKLIYNPRSKPVENQWRKSKDGKWLWKGDTSSDEMCGHMAGYYFFYEFVANDDEKVMVSQHVKKIMDYIIANDYTFRDIDGSHTTWGVWSPKILNHDPDWGPERGINSLELLSYLKLTYHLTGEEKYQEKYLQMINKEGYLENGKRILTPNPAWVTYIDPELLFLVWSPLLKYETNASLKKEYEELIDAWYETLRKDESPFYNFMYCYLRNKNVDLDKSINFLTNTSLDLVAWRFDQTKREDVEIVVFQTEILLPASERATVRWDRNPWVAITDDPSMEREPVFWLLPYWMARYLKILR